MSQDSIAKMESGTLRKEIRTKIIQESQFYFLKKWNDDVNHFIFSFKQRTHFKNEGHMKSTNDKLQSQFILERMCVLPAFLCAICL